MAAPTTVAGPWNATSRRARGFREVRSSPYRASGCRSPSRGALWIGSPGLAGTVVLLPAFGRRAPRGTPIAPGRLAPPAPRRLPTDSRVVLVGHSASCQIVAEAAVRRPDASPPSSSSARPPTRRPRPGPRSSAAGCAPPRTSGPGQIPLLVHAYARTGLVSMARGMDAARHHRLDAHAGRRALPGTRRPRPGTTRSAPPTGRPRSPPRSARHRRDAGSRRTHGAGHPARTRWRRGSRPSSTNRSASAEAPCRPGPVTPPGRPAARRPPAPAGPR